MVKEESLSRRFYGARLVEIPGLRERLEDWVRERVPLGFSEVMIRAGVKASIQRFAMKDGLLLEPYLLDWLIDP